MAPPTLPRFAPLSIGALLLLGAALAGCLAGPDAPAPPGDGASPPDPNRNITSWSFHAGAYEGDLSARIRAAYETTHHRLLLPDRLPATLNERQVRVAEWFARLTRERPRLAVKFNDVHAAFPALPRRTLTYDLGTLVDAGVLGRRGERKGTRYRFVQAR